MPYQNISATLPDQNLAEIKAAIVTIRANMSFLISLTADERRKRIKMGDKSLAFVRNSISATQNNSEILPGNFNVEEFEKDYRLTVALTEILGLLNQLSEEVDDTLIAVGSEAMASSLLVYDFVKAAAKHSPGLKSVADQLGERFKSIGNRRPKTDKPTV